MKKIVKDRDDIGFWIKMFPLKSHPAAYNKAKAVVCEKSLRLLDDAFAGKQLPPPSCETTEVDDNIKLGASIGITGTPAIILQDGAIVPGYRDAAVLIQLIEQAGAAVEPEEGGDMGSSSSDEGMESYPEEDMGDEQ